jgi:gluconolactonase
MWQSLARASSRPIRAALLIASLCVWPLSASAQLPGARDVRIDEIEGVVAADSQWELAWHGTDNADGIVGLPDGSVLFAQEQPRLIGRLDDRNTYSAYLRETRGVGSLTIDRAGRLIGVERTCTDPGRRASEPCTERTAVSVIAPAREVLADSYQDAPLGRLNDLVARSAGGVYFTVGGAFFVDTAGRVTSLGDELRANGIMLSRDERTLYVTNGGVIVAFSLAADGTPTERRDFARLEAGGNGDGMAVDEDGRLYVTSPPGVQVFEESGRYLGLVPTPRNAISVAFAGPGKRMLYVVGSGAALGPNGSEFATLPGVRNNAKSIYRVPMIARGFAGRAK